MIDLRYKTFNNKELNALKNIDGNVKEIMKLSEINIEPNIETSQFKAMGSRLIQPKQNFCGFFCSAKVDDVYQDGQALIERGTYSGLSFRLSEAGTTINCYLDDVEEIRIGDTIEFTADYERN